ncbi:MAG TPA: heme-binding protein [Microbacteriaceae bacterium]
MTEIQPYRVIDSKAGYEIRSYPPHFLVSVWVSGDMRDSGNSGFGQLFGYISGANQDRQKIPMTAPVLQKKQGDGYWLSFVMPADTEFPPLPLSPDLKIVGVEPVMRAVIKFSGSVGEKKFREQEAKLRSMATEKLAEGAIYARYDGPFKAPFLRRNEVLVDLGG